jgi:ABC-type phosphate transport system substrate-binding protein
MYRVSGKIASIDRQLMCGLLLWFLSNGLAAETVVIVNPENPIAQLSAGELRSIFLGRLLEFPKTQLEVIPVDQGPKTKIRESFYRNVANKSPQKMNSYWARFMFTGKGNPPKVVATDEEVKQMVAENVNAIGYIEQQLIDSSVKVVHYLSVQQ